MMRKEAIPRVSRGDPPNSLGEGNEMIPSVATVELEDTGKKEAKLRYCRNHGTRFQTGRPQERLIGLSNSVV